MNIDREQAKKERAVRRKRRKKARRKELIGVMRRKNAKARRRRAVVASGKCVLFLFGLHFGAKGVIYFEEKIEQEASATMISAVEALGFTPTAVSDVRVVAMESVPSTEALSLRVPNFDGGPKLTRRRRALAEAAAKKYKVDPDLVLANMAVESDHDANAISPKGAIGLMQVMPANAKWCGLKSPSELLDEEKNIDCGVKLLAAEMEFFNNDPRKALQSYNGSRKCVGVCRESIQHAERVLTLYARG